MRTEDIAKLGLLYLQKGQWNGKQILPAQWVAEATARQTSNGSAPTSDWDQGYGYQFWQSRHGFRGDGAFGPYMLILPQYDAVVAITSGVRDMQAVMKVTTPIGLGAWVTSTGWTNGIDRALSVTSPVAIGASGGWSTDSVFTVKLVAPETPFYSTMQFRFAADGLMLDGEMNVSFGERSLERLVGRPAEGAR